MKLHNELEILNKPDCISYSNELFGIKKRLPIRHFSKKTDLVPTIDKSYVFDETTTISTLHTHEMIGVLQINSGGTRCYDLAIQLFAFGVEGG